MSGVKWLYISKEDKVFKVPNPKNNKYKAVKELAGQNVLKVMMYYETKDRKPERLLIVEFDRIRLDAKGNYELSEVKMKNVMQNALHFMYATPQQLANSEGPIVLPIAPCIPSSKEKVALYAYLNSKIPSLGKDAPKIVENTVSSLQNVHKGKIDMIKEANTLSRLNL